MTDEQLAEYITMVWNTLHIRGSYDWYIQHSPLRGYVLFSKSLPSTMNEFPIHKTIPILRSWIENPETAHAYIATPSSYMYRIKLAKYFLEHGGP